jgi:hydroxyacylglutathione hydrolase
VHVIHHDQNAVVIDPGESEPVVEFLQQNHLKCPIILVTHHHSDHIHGLLALQNELHCRVYAPLKNKRQIHYGVTDFISGDETIQFEDLTIQAMQVPGHTLGHLAYFLPQQKWLFSGDVLFALGCGRIFEGSFEQMFETLQHLKELPEETLVFCSHDYYQTNRRFSEIEGYPLQGYAPTLPLNLKQEKAFNPFLKASTVQEFQKIREKRNHF